MNATKLINKYIHGNYSIAAFVYLFYNHVNNKKTDYIQETSCVALCMKNSVSRDPTKKCDLVYNQHNASPPIHALPTWLGTIIANVSINSVINNY